MKILKNILKEDLNIRTQKDFPIKEIEFIDITPLMLQNGVFSEIISKLYDELKYKNIDYIIAPEARGYVFGSILANKLDTGFIPVRKKGKLPPNFIEKSFESTKEYGVDILELPKLVNGEYKNKRIYIIDDIYATGNTIKSIKENLESLGSIVVGVGVVINISNLNDDKDVFSIIDIEET